MHATLSLSCHVDYVQKHPYLLKHDLMRVAAKIKPRNAQTAVKPINPPIALTCPVFVSYSVLDFSV